MHIIQITPKSSIFIVKSIGTQTKLNSTKFLLGKFKIVHESIGEPVYSKS